MKSDWSVTRWAEGYEMDARSQCDALDKKRNNARGSFSCVARKKWVTVTRKSCTENCQGFALLRGGELGKRFDDFRNGVLGFFLGA